MIKYLQTTTEIKIMSIEQRVKELKEEAQEKATQLSLTCEGKDCPSRERNFKFQWREEPNKIAFWVESSPPGICERCGTKIMELGREYESQINDLLKNIK